MVRFSSITNALLVLTIAIATFGCASGRLTPAHYFLDNQWASGAFQIPVWILNLDYLYQPGIGGSDKIGGRLTVDSTFTLTATGIKAIHLQIIFIDAEGKVLSKPEFQNINEIPGTTIQNQVIIQVPRGAVGFAFEGDTRGGRPSGDNATILGLPQLLL